MHVMKYFISRERTSKNFMYNAFDMILFNPKSAVKTPRTPRTLADTDTDTHQSKIFATNSMSLLLKPKKQPGPRNVISIW